MVKVREDLTGQRFGKLIVLKQVEDKIKPNGVHEAMWNCKCDCGNECNVRGATLKNGDTTSCGCYQKERVSQSLKKYNNYIFKNNYIIGIDDSGNRFIFDIDDYGIISPYYWYVDKNNYVVSYINNKYIFMHRFLMNPNQKFVDHINRNTTDNRKSNLRLVTNQENKMNHNLSSNNSSGISGVAWIKNQNKWRAYIKYKGKSYYLGQFINKEEAIKQRLLAELKYFGFDFAPQKHLFKKYLEKVENGIDFLT